MLNLPESIFLLGIIFIGLYFFIHIYGNYTDSKEEDSKFFKRRYMGSILLLFGILKLYNLKKFAEIFRKYDLIAQKLPLYAFIYPFLEIALGYYYWNGYNMRKTSKITNILMAISIISVIISLFKGKKLRCGCLGSFFHIPLSYVTISENLLMLYLNKMKIIKFKKNEKILKNEI